MSKSKARKKAAAAARSAPRRNTSADGEVTIVGNQVTLRGKAAQEVEDCCRLTGIEPKTLLTKMLQVSVERYKIEKPKRLEDLDWEAWANLMYQRLQGRKAGDRAKS